MHSSAFLQNWTLYSFSLTKHLCCPFHRPWNLSFDICFMANCILSAVLMVVILLACNLYYPIP
uniref:Uncharacterized protein n=1 Tax=Rhizophora mucronata TaxID=61149 RepID=A0A2P2N2U7_RHIMU